VSNRTIVEINHDRWHAIEMDPADFARDLVTFLGSASKRNADELEVYGFRVIETAHHSTDREVRVEGRVYPL
jgi:hypothetical protein